jgi:hypothetical protein
MGIAVSLKTPAQEQRSPPPWSSLIAVRMTVAPVPVVPLHSVVLPVVLTIAPVLCCQVTPVGVVFAIVPVMVIAVVSIVDPHLDAGLLRLGFGHNQGRCNNGSGQE